MASGGGKGGDRRVPVPALLWYSGILELGIGAFMLISPGLFAADSYAPIHPFLGLVAALFVLGGAAAILAVSGLCPPRLLGFAPLAAAIPMAVLAENFLLTSVATGVITYSLQVVALVAGAWFTFRREQPRVRVYVHMVGAVLIALGLAMLADQEHFSNQLTYSDLGRFLWLVIPLFLVAGLGLILAELRATKRPVANARLVLAFASLAAIGLGILVVVFATSQVWTGVFCYGVMLVVLLIAAPRIAVWEQAPILFASLAAVAAVCDLALAVVTLAGVDPIVSAAAIMRPATAVTVAYIAVGVAIALHPSGKFRGLTLTLAATAGVLAGLGTVLTMNAVNATPEDLLGHVTDTDLFGAGHSSPILLVASIVLLVYLLRPKGRLVPHLFVALSAAAIGYVSLNVFAYMIGSPFLLDVLGPMALRQHTSVAIGGIAIALGAAGISRLLRAPIGDRLFGVLAAFAILVVIRGWFADAALGHVFVDTDDVYAPQYLVAISQARDLMLALILGFAITIGAVFTRTVTYPLHAVLEAIARTRGGEARAHADIEGDDEIGVLAHSFNQLTRELADQSDLNEAVRRAQSDLGEAIVILENGVPRQWNEALTRITGYSDADLHAMHSLFDLLPDDQRADVEEIARTRVRDTFTFETEILRRNGERAYLEIAVIPLRNMRPPQQLAIVRDISERKSAERSLERLALHDALTDLPNRALLTDRLERTIAAAGRANDSFALLYLDLDRFKQVNDAFGHDAGDELLRELAVRLGRPLTSTDTLARFGGDEFAILLPRAGTADEALDTAGVIRGVLQRPIDLRGHKVFVEASMGVVRFPTDGTDADTLLRHADIAMYQAKRSGKDLIAYEAEHDPQSQHRLDLMSELRHAIERKELVLHYQPQIRLIDGGCCGALEALVRWNHPTRGMVAPGEFIPLAEESGFINELTLWVLDEATREIASLRTLGLEPHLAVNLSTRNLYYPGIVEAVAAALRAQKLHPSQLTCEITETAVMQDATRSLDTLNRLSALGVRLSIDDFGTGYSSLAYLRRLPVNELKIDKSFIIDMLANPSSDAIVGSTIQLAHSLGLTIVAEGVENQATQDALRIRRCDIAQGYHVARPMAYDQLVVWLKARRSSVEILDAAG